MQAIKLVLYATLALVLAETTIGMAFAGLFGMALVDYIQIKRGNILLA